MEYTELSLKERQDILRRVQSETGMDLHIIEKDWWVTTVLRALFSLPYAEHLSFKGGSAEGFLPVFLSGGRIFLCICGRMAWRVPG